MLAKIITVIFIVLTFQSIQAYDYPIKNPLYATIAGSKQDLNYKVEKAPIIDHHIARTLRPELPEILWDVTKISFSTAVHRSTSIKRNARPLIFIIAGTGGSYRSDKMQFLQNVFWEAGLHVICLNSPINRGFITNCSTSGYPGISEEDAQDIYEVMKKAYSEIRGQIEVSEFYLTGYSLGGLESAFVAKHDESAKFFNFKKVMLINPPVDVYSSVSILDNYLGTRFKGDKDILTTMMEKMSAYFAVRGEVGVDEEFLYKMHEISPVTEVEAEKIIGAGFRFSLAEMVFVCDLLHNKQLIIDHQPSIGEPLLPYFKQSLMWSFQDYLDYYLYPYWSTNNPGKTKDDLINQISLRSIEAYLKSSDKIALVHNKDDIIMKAGEIEYLQSIFSSRAKIYPLGGHCGNFSYRPNVEYILNYFTK